MVRPEMKPPRSFLQPVVWMLIGGGIIGLISSFIISLDKIKLLENPSFRPNCDLNPIISCGSVMASKQGSVFGFPNPWIGLVTFAMLITIGVALLAGGRFKRWFWNGLQIGAFGSLLFAIWLLFESVYRIQALCPYCLAVDVVVITLTWYLLLYNLEAKNIVLPARLRGVGAFMRRHHLDILILVFVLLIVVILKHFWYYYGQHL
jgi:uncharacterized membrane protein